MKIAYITSQKSGKSRRMTLWMEAMRRAGHEVVEIKPEDCRSTSIFSDYFYDESSEVSGKAWRKLNDTRNRSSK